MNSPVIGAALLAGVALLACGAPGPGSGSALPKPASGPSPARARLGYTAADVEFMQGMIVHHAQALDMTVLIASRTTRADIRRLGDRIAISQRDEIAMMQRWLEARGEELPTLGAHAHHSADSLVPGMLTPDETTRLARATGRDFVDLFLRLMIKHHEGALTMVGNLFRAHGAAQDTDIFFFASDVDADQRAEISRLRSMLTASP